MTLAKFHRNRTTGSKVMGKKFHGTGIEYPEPEPGNRDLIPVEPGNKKSGYLTTLPEILGEKPNFTLLPCI